MSGKVTFQFDDGFYTHYDKVFPLFKEFGVVGGLSIIANPDRGMGFARVKEMQDAGWEIISHTVTHPKMSMPIDEEVARREIFESRDILKEAGLDARVFVTPCSVLHPMYRPMVESVYDAAFTCYTNSLTDPIEDMVIRRPVDAYSLNRACLSGKTSDELKEYIDYVEKNDAWLIFYDHNIGEGANSTPEILRELLSYIKEKGVAVMTTTEALKTEKCVTKIVREGWDGKKCFVHTRMASNGKGKFLATAQKLNVKGSDLFDILNVSTSPDGKTWTEFTPDEAFLIPDENGVSSVCCDMTPFYHKKTGKFIATGHIAQYLPGSLYPLSGVDRRIVTPYAVYDEEKGVFEKAKTVKFPEGDKYCDCGSGCSQCFELPDGDILMPISFCELKDGEKADAKAAVVRCSFDGETLKIVEIGGDIEVENEVRGIGECSVSYCDGRYFLTIRGDTYGYVAVSDDGINYSTPEIWKWDNGETVPTYNTQSHFFRLGGKLYLVYTRKAGFNDHVFRHRAPLFVSEVDTDKVCLKRDTEFIAVPERGARLGNFGAFEADENTAYIVASEWMQPEGCEKYGSNNALWLTKISK